MLITNTSNIQEVLLFPAMKPDTSEKKVEGEKPKTEVHHDQVKPESH